MTDIKCVRVSFECIDGERDIRYSPNFRGSYVEAEKSAGCLILSQLLYNHWIVNVPHDRHTSQPGNKLAQQIEKKGELMGKRAAKKTMLAKQVLQEINAGGRVSKKTQLAMDDAARDAMEAPM